MTVRLPLHVFSIFTLWIEAHVDLPVYKPLVLIYWGCLEVYIPTVVGSIIRILYTSVRLGQELRIHVELEPYMLYINILILNR